MPLSKAKAKTKAKIKNQKAKTKTKTKEEKEEEEELSADILRSYLKFSMVEVLVFARYFFQLFLSKIRSFSLFFE